jgi:hypothetical protein
MHGNLTLIPGRATTSGGDCPARMQRPTPPTLKEGRVGTRSPMDRSRVDEFVEDWRAKST